MKPLLVRFLHSRLGFTHRLRAGLLILVATTTAAVFASPSPSMASGDNFYAECTSSSAVCQEGTLVSGWSGDRCATASYGLTKVCIAYTGDYVYVYDGAADGNSALADIWASSGIIYRYCRNKHGYGTWARCNFDWDEIATKDVHGGVLYSYYSNAMDYLWSFSGK